MAQLAGQPASPRILRSLSPWCWDFTDLHCCASSLTWVLGVQTQAPTLVWQRTVPIEPWPQSSYFLNRESSKDTHVAFHLVAVSHKFPK